MVSNTRGVLWDREVQALRTSGECYTVRVFSSTRIFRSLFRGQLVLWYVCRVGNFIKSRQREGVQWCQQGKMRKGYGRSWWIESQSWPRGLELNLGCCSSRADSPFAQERESTRAQRAKAIAESSETELETARVRVIKLRRGLAELRVSRWGCWTAGVQGSLARPQWALRAQRRPTSWTNNLDEV
jgi:hypothetical protein